MKTKSLSTVPLALLSVLSASAELPPLVGDGVADDTAAIQARLDSGASCVYLPPPKDHYVISKTLKIGSQQELRLDRATRVRLAPKSDCAMLENRAYAAGSGTNAFVALTGGIWDMDNRNQSPNPSQTPAARAKFPKVHTPSLFLGIAIRFCHVENLAVHGVTIRNPTIYGMEFGHVSQFIVDDVTFDYKTWNPMPLNMDGVHLDGFCHHGKISNLRGTCFDDLVALNANDGICSPEEGPITDVDIDGVYADYCHSAARILSAGADIKRITIRNVHGHFYCYTVGLTHYFPEKPRGRFDDIVIENVFASKALVPPECGGQEYRGPMEVVHLQGPIDVGNIVVSRVYRDESCLPTATIGVDEQATVENLAVRDCRMTNRLKEPIQFVLNRGKVAKAVFDNNTFVGAWTDREIVATPIGGVVSAASAAKAGFKGTDPRATQLRDVAKPPLRVLFVGAHPDDTDILCPAASMRLVKAGARVKWLSMTNGDRGHQFDDSATLARRRRGETLAAAKITGIEEYMVSDTSDCHLAPSLEERAKMTKVIREFKPHVIVTHRTGDYHPDHRATGQIVMDATYLSCVPLWAPEYPCEEGLVMPAVFFYVDRFTAPTPSRCDLVIGSDDELQKSAAALACHESQLFEWLPPEKGIQNVVPPASDPDARVAFSKKHWIDPVHYGQAAKYAKEVAQCWPNGDAPKTVECFEVSEYCRLPSDWERKELEKAGFRWVPHELAPREK